MSRHSEHPTAPRGAPVGNARVLSDISGSDRMEEARRRRERALAVTAPANTDGAAVAAPMAIAAIPPARLGRRVLDGALVAGAFLLGAALFAPLAGYAAMGKLPFNLGAGLEPGPALAVATVAPSAPVTLDASGPVPVAFAGSGGTRPPLPPGLPRDTMRDPLPAMGFGGAFVATTLTTAPALASPAPAVAAFSVEALRPVDKALPIPTLAAVVPEQVLPQVQETILGVNVFVHAPGTAQQSAASAITVLRTVGLEATLTAPVAFGISQSNIRYFHAEDRAAAAEVARLLNADLRDFTDFRPSPRAGTVEVWIAGRASAPQPQPLLREVPLVDFSSLPVPEALAPLPQETRRNGVFSRLFGGTGNRANRFAERRESDDDDDGNRFDRSARVEEQAAAPDDSASDQAEAEKSEGEAAQSSHEGSEPIDGGDDSAQDDSAASDEADSDGGGEDSGDADGASDADPGADDGGDD
ncbi:MAG: hypothetical protein AAFQ39_05515 [Pseudomonadota bacterium]